MSTLTILFLLFIVIVLIQFIFYVVIFSKFAFSKDEKPSQKNVGVSVLICAKNESDNLKEFVPKIIAQDYPKFEIILINDASDDDSFLVMKNFEEKHPNIKVVDVAPNDTFLSKKKYALTLGIKIAQYNFLLFTDADCHPVSNQWIKSMSSHFTNKKTIVLGYGAYNKIRKSLLNKLIRFETLLTAIQYFSFTKIGMPYMGVGRNLAYRKEEFFNSKGFTSHIQIRSGDDDLFVNQVATSKNTTINFNRESFTESIPNSSFKKWKHQKRRHVTTASHYKFFHKVILTLFFLSQLAFWILFVSLLITTFQLQWVLLLALFRFLFLFIIVGLSAKKLNELDLLVFLPFLELFLISSQLIIFISNLTSKSHIWR